MGSSPTPRTIARAHTAGFIKGDKPRALKSLDEVKTPMNSVFTKFPEERAASKHPEVHHPVVLG